MIGTFYIKPKPALCAILILVMLLAAAPVYGAEYNPHVIEVEQIFTGPETADGSFSYILEPQGPENPMPAGSGAAGYVFQIDGTSVKSLAPISFDQRGVYYYKAYQLTGTEKEYYTYDRKVYWIEIFVDEHLNAIRVVYEIINGEKSADKAPKIEFANSYYRSTGPGTGPTDDPPGRKETSDYVAPPDNTFISEDSVPAIGVEEKPADPVDVPKTGDELKAALYYMIFGLGAAAAIAAVIYLIVGNRRKKDCC